MGMARHVAGATVRQSRRRWGSSILVATLDGESLTFAAADVRRVYVDAGAGNDVVRNDAGLVSTILGRDGDDDLRSDAVSFVFYRAALFFVSKGDMEKADELSLKISDASRRAVVCFVCGPEPRGHVQVRAVDDDDQLAVRVGLRHAASGPLSRISPTVSR